MSCVVCQNVTLNLNIDELINTQLDQPWKRTACKIVILAPKGIFSGLGRVVGGVVGAGFGFGIGGLLGAGIGSSLGTLIGCGVSFGLELLIRKYVLHDKSLTWMNVLVLAKSRAKISIILAVGSLFSGITFNGILSLDSSLTISVCASVSSVFAALAGMTFARGVYTSCVKNPGRSVEISRKNLKKDIVLSLSVILPAQLFFGLSSIEILGAFTKKSLGYTLVKGAAAVSSGGVLGRFSQTLIKRAFNSENFIQSRT